MFGGPTEAGSRQAWPTVMRQCSRGVTRRRRPYGRQQREGAGMFKALVNRRDHHNIDVSGIVN
jgi:hypothetical protein